MLHGSPAVRPFVMMHINGKSQCRRSNVRSPLMRGSYDANGNILSQREKIPVYAWIFLSSHAMFSPRTFMVFMPSSSFFTSCSSRPMPTFQ